MKRWWYARAREDLSQIRKPGGTGFLGHSPQWLDYTTSPDFWRKQRRKGLVEVLSEQDENPKLARPEPEQPKKLSKAERRRQAEIDLENVRDAIKATGEDLERLESLKTAPDLEASRAAEIESAKQRLAVLEKTKARLAKELAVKSPKGGDEEE